MQSKQEQTNRTIYVGNLHPLTTPETLLDVFKSCGEVSLLRMAQNTAGHDTRFAFIEFRTLAAANIARDLHGLPLLDRLIKVNSAKAPMMVPSNCIMKGPIIIDQPAQEALGTTVSTSTPNAPLMPTPPPGAPGISGGAHQPLLYVH